jgi:hypothetical protein
MKKKIDAHTERLNARLAAEQAAERKLTKDQRKALKDAHETMARAVYSLGEFNDIWMSDYYKLKEAYFDMSSHFSLGGDK